MLQKFSSNTSIILCRKRFHLCCFHGWDVVILWTRNVCIWQILAWIFTPKSSSIRCQNWLIRYLQLIENGGMLQVCQILPVKGLIVIGKWSNCQFSCSFQVPDSGCCNWSRNKGKEWTEENIRKTTCGKSPQISLVDRLASVFCALGC